jgi:hypothetical protein
MNGQVVDAIIQCLDMGQVHGVVRDYLIQSARAGRTLNVSLMRDLAEVARRLARGRSDQLGEAAALLHLGIAAAAAGQLSDARAAVERARGIYRREPSARFRFHEGLATYLLAMWTDSPGYGRGRGIASPKGLAQTLDALERAQTLLDAARTLYAAEGDWHRCRQIQKLDAQIRRSIDDRIPTVWVDGKAC